MTDWRQFVREHLPPLGLNPARVQQRKFRIGERWPSKFFAPNGRSPPRP
jgi:hypothetical protein